MDLSRKACLCIIILIVTAGSLACGCICGVLQPGQPAAVNNKTGDTAFPGESIAISTPLPDATARVASTPEPTPYRRPPEFTVHAAGGKDHRWGETIRIYGVNTYSDIVYLFVSGTMTPVCGGRIDNAKLPVVDGDAKTFVRIGVSDDGSWAYNWTPPRDRQTLMFDLYNLIAVAEPRDRPHLDDASAWGMVTVKISQH